MSSPPTVIIFGPTGNIGSHAAIAAHALDATVILAMRDPSKLIPGLPSQSPSQLQPNRYHRVQADLHDPTSITSNPSKWRGATAAFVYLALGAGPDGMRATFRALWAVGVRRVVFLSSYTVGAAPWLGDTSKVPPEELIAKVHARAEEGVREVFGGGSGEGTYVLVRPGGFATNLLRYRCGILAGEVRLRGGAFRTDLVTPEDMGAVCAELVVNGPKEDGEEVVYVFGPQVVETRVAVEMAARALGREKTVQVQEIGDEEALKQFDDEGVPRPFAEYIVSRADQLVGVPDEMQRPEYERGVANVKRYTGRESMAFEEWVRKNKARFEA